MCWAAHTGYVRLDVEMTDEYLYDGVGVLVPLSDSLTFCFFVRLSLSLLPRTWT